MPYLKSYNP